MSQLIWRPTENVNHPIFIFFDEFLYEDAKLFNVFKITRAAEEVVNSRAANCYLLFVVFDLVIATKSLFEK